MQTRILTRSDLSNFMPLMTNEEIFGLDLGRHTCFGAYDEENDIAAGILTADVYPEFIRIRRLYVRGDYRRQGIATDLLSLVCDLPSELKLPVRFYTVETEVNQKNETEDDREERLTREKFLSDSHFEKEEIALSCVSSTLNEMTTISANKLPHLQLCVGAQIPEGLLSQYVLNLPHDTIVQFPEEFVDMERFSEGSIVCLKNGKICGAVLLEELEHTLQIPWFYADDPATASFLFIKMRGFLLSEYGKGTKIRFVFGREMDESVPRNMFRKCDTQAVELYQLKEER